MASIAKKNVAVTGVVTGVAIAATAVYKGVKLYARIKQLEDAEQRLRNENRRAWSLYGYAAAAAEREAVFQAL